jgi:predicted NAD/FAD-binding protein
MKIAIIGAGISGNVAAYRLNKEHDISVFEAGSYVGGHTNTVDIPSKDGTLAIDTGFIVFNNRTYPNFIKLLDEIGVESKNSEMSFSVRKDRPALEYNGSNLNGLFAQRQNLLRPSFHRMIRDILRFNREAPEFLKSDDQELSLGEFLKSRQYCNEFMRHYLIPMGAAIWSAELDLMDQMPAHFFIRFFQNHGLLSLKDRPVWRVIEGGSREYVGKLVADHLDRIRLNCPVESVTRLADGVVVKARGVEAEKFDAAFFACHSDQALQILSDPSAAEREILGAIEYQGNEAVLHTDDSLMPRRKRAWASWNYHLRQSDGVQATLTYHMNCLQRLNARQQYFVTLNSADLIRPEAVLRTVNYEHPVFTAKAVNAQRRKAEIDGVNRTYFCGAYWRNGFHEDGVVSALSALESFQSGLNHEQQYFQRAS